MKKNLNYSSEKKNSFMVLHNDFKEQPNKLCLFASYNFTDKVADYVIYYLSAIHAQGFTIAFVSTSKLQNTCIDKLQQFCSVIIERENKGLDFASWQCALRVCNWAENVKEVLVVNDSVFGPFNDLGTLINRMNKQFDVWGLTDNYDIDYHIQSYFLHFNEKVIKSAHWLEFWQGINTSGLIKEEIIRRYEVGLSQFFLNAGFKIGVYTSIDTLTRSSGINDKEISPPLVYWQSLIEKFNFPFLKRELLINTSISKAYWHRNIYVNTSRWRKVIEKETAYPLQLIDDYLKEYVAYIQNENPRIKTKKKKLIFVLQNTQAGDSQKVLLNFLNWLHNNTDIPFETIISNPSEGPNINDDLAALCSFLPFWALTDHEKYELKDRLSSESVGLVLSNNLVNVEVQQFLSFLAAPQILYVTELPEVLNVVSLFEKNKYWLKENVLHYVAGTVAIKERLQQYLGLDANKLSVVYGFIDNIQETKNTADAVTFSKTNLSKNAFIVGIQSHPTAADLIPVIAAMLCRQQKDIHVLWLGIDTNSPSFEIIENDFKKTGIVDQVHFIPSTKNQADYYNLLDVFVMPSKADSFPLGNIEIAAKGIPVICFQNSVSSADTNSLKITKQVPYLDLTAIRDVVLNYYTNKTELKATAQVISKAAKDNFSTENQAPKLYSIITDYFDENEYVPVEQPAITIMTHLFYDDTWKDIKYKLNFFKELNTQFLFSISEACLIKEELVQDIKTSFPNAHVLTTSNIGKDIGGKFALIDLYLSLELESEYIIFLHDKQSPHSLIGESWKNNLQKVVDRKNYKQILDAFEQNEHVGVVGAREHLICEYDNTNGTFLNNNDRIHLFLKKYNISIDNYYFFGGTMYWMRANIIENFFTRFNPMHIRAELEAGNVLDNHGSTNAHTWERVLSWVATNQGYQLYGI